MSPLFTRPHVRWPAASTPSSSSRHFTLLAFTSLLLLCLSLLPSSTHAVHIHRSTDRAHMGAQQVMHPIVPTAEEIAESQRLAAVLPHHTIQHDEQYEHNIDSDEHSFLAQESEMLLPGGLQKVPGTNKIVNTAPVAPVKPSTIAPVKASAVANSKAAVTTLIPTAPTGATTPLTTAPITPLTTTPAKLTCGTCRNGECAYKDNSKLATYCQCKQGYFGDECQYGPAGGSLCLLPSGVLNNRTTAYNRDIATTFETYGISLSKPCGIGGECINGLCVCSPGYTGGYCQLAPCPNSCSNAGYCVHTAASGYKPRCMCQYGTSGADCSVGSCGANGCSGHGTCKLATAAGKSGFECVCEPGWSGPMCSIAVCPTCVHGTCNSDKKCECTDGFTGVQCDKRPCKNNCNGRGSCNPQTGFCNCATPWTGDDCSVDTRNCPNRCSGNGFCTSQGCRCLPLWSGPDCSVGTCLNNCTGLGTCVNGKCQCYEGFTGKDCSEFACPDNCNDVGVCLNGKCLCPQPYSGEACENVICPNHCSGHGQCQDGYCQCYNSTQVARLFPASLGKHVYGYTGIDCTHKRCATDCGVKQGRGSCNTTTGICQCNPQYTSLNGQDCASNVCGDNCSGHGKCVNDKCYCERTADGRGWQGAHCELEVCPKNCSYALGQGQCVDSYCQCSDKYYGRDCSQLKCPLGYSPLGSAGSIQQMCSSHGDCENGVCKCHPNFKGLNCNIRDCPGNCTGRGLCLKDGTCECNTGYTGADCSKLKCQFDCGEALNRGRCDGNTGQCVCEKGYFGKDCRDATCDQSCGGNGRCLSGQCVCFPGTGVGGWKGAHCEIPICPNNCSFALGQGQCIADSCVCKPGFYGDCMFKDCPVGIAPLAAAGSKPVPCSGHGTCVNGTCACSPAFTGPSCSVRSCSYGCYGNGQCVDGECVCKKGDENGIGGFTGRFCETPLCPGNCTSELGHGQCVKGQCVCKDAFYGADCKYPKCPAAPSPLGLPGVSLPVMCAQHGDCVNGTCVCHPGFNGTACTIRTCPNNCNGPTNGVCKSSGFCQCNEQYEGEDCSRLSCPKGCNGRGFCLNGRCQCGEQWTGDQCQIVKCPNNCGGHGICTTIANDVDATGSSIKACVCEKGWTGPDCMTPVCDPVDCKGKGQCVVDEHGRHVCQCFAPYSGADCGNQLCNNTCSYHGDCINGKCVCDAGWAGPNCEFQGTCSPPDCSGRGKCVADGNTGRPICQCAAPFGGAGCTQCMSNCTGHGQCTDKGCACDVGWYGEQCDRTGECDVRDCNQQGKCVGDRLTGKQFCRCYFPWSGPNCDQCTLNCTGHGACGGKGCVCDDGWSGDNCEVEGECQPADCGGHGRCTVGVNGAPTCQCDFPWTGPGCASQLCHLNCTGNSHCEITAGRAQCVCNTGFTGKECEIRPDCSPKDCNGRGVCMTSANGLPQCSCKAPYTGPGCADKFCTDSCSVHGTCINDKCQCKPGWTGKKCETLDCSAWNGCSGNGNCTLTAAGEATCACSDPYTGSNCTAIKCQYLNCNNGACVNGKCVCNKGWLGKYCDYIEPCSPSPTCNFHGECIGDGKGLGKSMCKCEFPFSGPACADVECDRKCSGRGKCKNFACQCEDGWGGNNCEFRVNCTESCGAHGKCQVDPRSGQSSCVCDEMWGGRQCSEQRGVCWLDGNQSKHCQCISPWYGANCTQRTCENGCENGACSSIGVCECRPGWKGVRCAEPICPEGCNGHGQCNYATARCTCDTGYTGTTCATFNQQVCVSSCQFKCGLNGNKGLIPKQDPLTGRWFYQTPADCRTECTEKTCKPQSTTTPTATTPTTATNAAATTPTLVRNAQPVGIPTQQPATPAASTA